APQVSGATKVAVPRLVKVPLTASVPPVWLNIALLSTEPTVSDPAERFRKLTPPGQTLRVPVTVTAPPLTVRLPSPPSTVLPPTLALPLTVNAPLPDTVRLP